jgi:hypothetical protein
MKKGDIVLIPFPFTNFKGNKLRPALILVNSETDITVCFITTQLKWKEATDLEIGIFNCTIDYANTNKRRSLRFTKKSAELFQSRRM